MQPQKNMTYSVIANARAFDAEAGGAVWIGAGHLGVGPHPVVRMGKALLWGGAAEAAPQASRSRSLARAGGRASHPQDRSSCLGSLAVNPLVWWADHLHSQVVEIEAGFGRGVQLRIVHEAAIVAFIGETFRRGRITSAVVHQCANQHNLQCLGSCLFRLRYPSAQYRT